MSIKAVKNGTRWTIREGYESITDKINLDDFHSTINGKPYKIIKDTRVRSVILLKGSDVSDVRHGESAAGTTGMYIKLFKHKNCSDYVKYLFLPTRTRTEWKVANRLLSKGINTALPLAIAEKRSWSLLDSSMLITKAVSRSEPLMEFCQTTFNGILSGEKLFEKKKLLNNLAGFIRNIHEKGFFHKDLHAGNILIKFNSDYFSPVKNYSFYLMDLHHVKILKTLSKRKRLHNLAQIFNSLSSILTKSDKSAFVKSYGINALSNINNERLRYQVDDHPISPPSRPAKPFGRAQGGERGEVTKSNGMLLDIEQLLVEKIEVKSLRIRNIHYKSRLKRCLKESSTFSKKRFTGMKMFFRKGYDTNSFPELIGEHHNALANNDKNVIIKRDSKTVLTRFPFRNGGIRSVVVKQFKITCGLCLLKNIIRNSAGRKAWVAGNGLSVYGFNSAKPLALIEKKMLGIVTDSYLIMEDTAHSLEMDRYILKNFHDQSKHAQYKEENHPISPPSEGGNLKSCDSTSSLSPPCEGGDKGEVIESNKITLDIEQSHQPSSEGQSAFNAKTCLKKKRTFINVFAETIAKMHNQNIFHSDLKTCNIMVKEVNDKCQARNIDKGVREDEHFPSYEGDNLINYSSTTPLSPPSQGGERREVKNSNRIPINIEQLPNEEEGKSFNFIFLDFDKVTFNEKISIRKRIKNFTQINLSTPRCITFTDRFRFLKEYLKQCNIADEKKTILREIINISKTEKILYVSFKGDVTEDW
ncbi:MAG: lipopolysaccharide kinase InaA family protein [Candidatus Scalinduaceae bacterium]